MTTFQLLFLVFELCIVVAMCITIAAMTMSMWNGAPFVPIAKGKVGEVLSLLALKPGQHFLELGSGDGRVVCAAVKQYSVIGRGIEISWVWITLAKLRARLMGVQHSVTFLHQNIISADIAWADVIYVYMMPRFLESFTPKLLAQARPGTRVLSYVFEIPQLESKRVNIMTETKYPLHLYIL